ncbi:MAG: hypothetical protein IIA87_00725 [Nanoarchaeota archaeon]|nr:hypothetical protein [Nanoarchaeota archaeon]
MHKKKVIQFFVLLFVFAGLLAMTQFSYFEGIGITGFAIFEDFGNSFNNGTFENTVYNGSSVVLSGSNLSGNYTSQVFDATQLATWNNISLVRKIPKFDYLYVFDNDKDVWRSSDDGTSWVEINNSYFSLDIYGITSTSDGLFVIKKDGQVHKSTDSGVTWSLVNSGDITQEPRGLTSDSSDNLYVVAKSKQIYQSINAGASWTLVNNSYTVTNNANQYGIGEELVKTNLTYQYRNCSLANCGGESFIGPDGTGDSFFTETVRDISLTSQYFQYKVYFSSDSPDVSPYLESVTIDYSLLSSGNATVPTVNIDYPSYSSTYGDNESLTLNFSVISDNLDSCWYTLNNGETNETIVNCENTTFSVAEDGVYNISVYANETVLGLEGSDSLLFYVNIGKPSVHLTSPQHNYYINATEVNFIYIPSSGVALDRCKLWGDFTSNYSLNQTNSNVISGEQSSFILNLSEGTYLWAIYCSDNINSAITGNRTLIVDITPPVVDITEPTGTYSSFDIPLDFDVNDSSPVGPCVYNISASGSGVSIEIIIIDPQCDDEIISVITVATDYDLTLTADDSAGNSGSDQTSFSVSGGGSSGGGSSSSGGSPGLTGPAEISFSELGEINMRRGQSEFIALEVLNSGSRFLNNCKLLAEGIMESWVSNKQVESLSSGQKVEYIFSLNVPVDVEPGKYSSILTVSCNEVSVSTSLNVNVIVGDFDFVVLSSQKEGTKLIVSYSLEELFGKDQDITLSYKLVNANEFVLLEGEEVIFIEAGKKSNLKLSFELPKNAVGELKLIMSASNGRENIVIEQDVILEAGRGLAGFVISEANRRTLSIAAIAIFVLLSLYFVLKFIYKHHERITKHGERGRHFIKIKLKE